MTAPNQFAPTSKKPLPKGSRPHMTQSRHETKLANFYFEKSALFAIRGSFVANS
jgi:hypothetical protein